MNETTLRSKLEKLRVTPPDIFMAALYLDRLEHVAAVFDVEFRANKTEEGFGEDYKKLESALTDSVLLTHLVEMFDEYILYALIADLIKGGKIQSGETEKKTLKNFIAFQRNENAYRQYFQEKIFGVSESHFQGKLTEFYNEYPRTKHAIGKITSNFINNIKLACKRIIADWSNIDKVFASGQGYELRKLIKIESSGSDFHKGGQQVLFLTFETFERQKMRHMPLKLIYKPADIEADCLIIGDSAAVNSVHRGFMDKSLMEIFNALIELNRQSNPNSILIKLPTYKILPYSFGSAAQPPAIKESYGYLEFLHHEELKHDPGAALYSPSTGPGDFVIYPQQDEERICNEFYRLIGQITAIACSFSFGDIHFENLIVHQYKPHLIDMESSLLKSMANIKATGLLMEKKNQDFAAITGTNGKTRLFVDAAPRRFVEPNNYVQSITTGLQQMMELMRAHVKHNDLAGWFTRIKKVIVRQVPISTNALTAKLKSLFDYKKCNEPMESFDADIAALFQEFEKSAYKHWTDELKPLFVNTIYNPQSFKPIAVAKRQLFWEKRVFPDPIFFALQEAYIKENYRNLDIPVYYHRIGGQDLLDYNGVKVTIAAQPYVLAQHYKDFLTYSGDSDGDRNSYFPLSSGYPTQRYVQEWQFAKLGDQTYFNNRVKALRDEIVAELQPSADMTTAAVLQQINVKTAPQ